MNMPMQERIQDIKKELTPAEWDCFCRQVLFEMEYDTDTVVRNKAGWLGDYLKGKGVEG